jgi:hypothetical protein
VGVTGHRDLLASEVEPLRAQVRHFFTGLAARYPALQLELVSGLASGADSLVAEVALEMAIPVVAVLPFSQAEYERDFDTPGHLQQFHQLLAQATVLTLPGWDNSTERDIHEDPRARTRQYAQLGVFLSNHCQVLLALWDGKHSSDVGGTFGVVRYHLTAVMPGFAVSGESPNLLADNENDLAYHIVCSRAREDGAPDPRFAALESYWITAHFGRQQGGDMPDEYHRMFERLNLFASDCARHREAIATQARSIIESHDGIEVPPGCARIDRIYQAADWLAVRYQKLFSRGLLLSHLLAVLMGLVFILYSEMVEYSFLAWLFLALFIFGIGFHMLGEKREWHRKYLDYRALAEGLRVQVYWNLAGVVDGHKAEFAYDNFLQKQDVDLAWIRHVMRSASLQAFRTDLPDPRWVDWVAGHWIGEAGQGSGQLAYYESKALLRSNTYRRTVLLGTIALWTGVSMALFLALFALRFTDQQILVLMILMGVLPLIAGVYDAYSHKKADKELIKQYQFMARIFANARRLMDDAEDTPFKRQVLKAVGSAALEEHAEWLLMHRERPLEHGGIS